ncbi:DUF6233 domain-containing protein [Streptomyces bobili]|uniref:DUF6233 domain-containing protein n=1 Tax=Streptomyces bobili TaxID=67280 RepID=UPI00371DE91A
MGWERLGDDRVRQIPVRGSPIFSLRRNGAEAERGRRARPQPPERVVELGTGHPPLQVHAGDCHMAGERHRAVGRDEARRLLTDDLRACSHPAAGDARNARRNWVQCPQVR